MDFINQLYQSIKSRFGDTSKWGQWVGAVIIADILGVWTYHCIKKQEIAALDVSAVSIILTVFLMNGLKTPPPSPPQSSV